MENTTKEYRKYMASKETNTIAADCDDVLALLQAVVVKAPKLADAPFLLQVDKYAPDWFLRCYTHHIVPVSTLVTATTQDRL